MTPSDEEYAAWVKKNSAMRKGGIKKQVVVSIVLSYSLSLWCCSLSLRHVRFSSSTVSLVIKCFV
jgi:hypothetical protein